MEQLQRDRNYSNYLVRLVEAEARKSNSKEDLIKFINQLNKSINEKEVIKYVQDNNLIFNYQAYNAQIQKILDEYDKIHEVPINSSDYKQMQVDNKNYIVSKEGSVLEQNSSKNLGDLSQDFKNKENEMIGAKTNDSYANANEAIKVMKQEMQQSNFMPLNKVDVNKIPQELIMKINFLIKNPNINYNEFQVDIQRGVFINTKENELYEVRRDTNTGEFKLYTAKQAMYTSGNSLNNSDNFNKDDLKLDKNDLTMFTDEELKEMKGNSNINEYEKDIILNEINKRNEEVIDNKNVNTNGMVKKRILSKDKIMPILSNGYVSTVLLTTVSAISGILIAALLLVNR